MHSARFRVQIFLDLHDRKRKDPHVSKPLSHFKIIWFNLNSGKTTRFQTVKLNSTSLSPPQWGELHRDRLRSEGPDLGGVLPARGRPPVPGQKHLQHAQLPAGRRQSSLQSAFPQQPLRGEGAHDPGHGVAVSAFFFLTFVPLWFHCFRFTRARLQIYEISVNHVHICHDFRCNIKYRRFIQYVFLHSRQQSEWPSIRATKSEKKGRLQDQSGNVTSCSILKIKS